MIQLPELLQDKAINFVLLERQGKKPFQKDWQKREIKYDSPEFVNHLNSGGNYGILGGGEKNLIIVDFDNEKVQDDAIKVLPETFTVKTGSGLLHKYFWSDAGDSFKIFSENMDTLADIQAQGKQVVGPGSIHPNGKMYEVVDNREIAEIDYSELKAIMMFFDRKPKKEVKIVDNIKPSVVETQNDFISDLKSRLSIADVLSHIGIDTSKNPTQCPFHSSEGGKCLGFKDEVAHCFHCDGSWNIFSLIKEYKKLDFKEALEYLAQLAGMEKELEESRKAYIEHLKENEATEEKEVKEAFLDCISDKKFNDASEVVSDYIKRHHHIYSTKDDNKMEMWIYREGIYVPNGKSEIKEILRNLLGSWYNTYYYNQIIAKIEPDTYIDQDEFFGNVYPDEVPVENGILNIRTRELKPFDPEKIFFNKLPVIYDPEAKCPAIDNFLKDVLAKEEDIKVFYEIVGFCLVDDYTYEKAFMFVGDGRNGKDKSLELIKRLIGVRNCCSVPLHSLQLDSFIISSMFGKKVNLAGEVSNTDLKDTAAFKACTGRSLLSAPRKFLNPIEFVNTAKFIFACNHLPMVYDNSRGFWSRWVLLQYPYTFVDAEELKENENNSLFKLKDATIIEKITTPKEMSGFLNASLDALDRLTEQKDFSSTLGSNAIKSLWIRKSNSVMAFCSDMIEDDYSGYISKKEFRKKYNDYCKEHKIKVYSDFVIKKTLSESYGVSEGKEEILGYWEQSWRGIKWKC